MSCLRPYLSILKLVWPLALGMINNAVMQFADRAFLAHESMQALEAVMPSSTLAWVFLGFFQAVVGYAGVFVAQCHGAGDEQGCIRSYRAAFLLSVVSSVLLVPLIPLGYGIFTFTAPSAELVALEREYYDIVLYGGFFLLAQMAAIAYFTGRGLTRIVFWVNLIGNALNVALDPILIFGWGPVPHLGMAGAAYATVIAQAVQFVVLVIAAHRATRTQRIPLFDRPLLVLLKRILRFGIPAGGYEILNMASFTAFVFVTGRVGDIAFAASNACFTINYLLFAPMTGFALGVQTLVGQARGRGDDGEAALALARTMKLGLSFVTIVLVAVLVLNVPLLKLFAPPDPKLHPEFITLGQHLLALMGAWMLFDASDVILSGALKGAGDTRFVFWWMLFCSFGLWLPAVGLTLYLGGSEEALWATMVVYVVIITCGTLIRWHKGRWRHIAPLIKKPNLNEVLS